MTLYIQILMWDKSFYVPMQISGLTLVPNPIQDPKSDGDASIQV